MRMTIAIRVNGQPLHVDVEPGAFLLDALRDELGLLDTKEACDEGECGACTVLVDGVAVDSCIYLAAAAEGTAITTAAGVAADPRWDRLREEMVRRGAVQCGFCTPGFLTAAAAFLGENPAPSPDQIRTGLAGNLCRCTGYTAIVDAISSISGDA